MSNPNDQVMKQNILKDVFSWEVPKETVPLPSQGKVYNPNSKLYNAKTVAIKAMTAKEEDILTSRALIREGTVVDELIRACLIDKSINVNDLIIGDKNALMISIRITGYGSDYHVNAGCTACGANNKLTVDLSSLEIKTLDIEPVKEGENLFKYVLPVTKKEVFFKFLCGKDEKEIEDLEAFQSKNFDTKITNSVTNFLFKAIQSIEGVTDKNKIKKFVENMPAYDSKSLRAFIDKNEPSVLMEHKFSCQSCNAENTAKLPVTIDFFWPAF